MVVVGRMTQPLVQLSSDRLHGFLLRLRPAARGSRLASSSSPSANAAALLGVRGSLVFCSRAGSGLELVVRGFARRDAFWFFSC